MPTLSADLPAIAELLRFDAPAPSPQALACDGDHLWISSWETGRLYRIDAHQGVVVDEATSPGKPVGAVMTGDELRVLLSEADDSRFVRRFVPGHGYKSEAVACPDDTGSFLAYDGECLWLSQRSRQRLLELDPAFAVVREFALPAQPLGLTWAGDRFFLSLWFGARDGGAALAELVPGDGAEARVVARSPFPMISLGWDGSRLWTNDARANQIVALARP